MKIFIATKNNNKIKEITQILKEIDGDKIEFYSINDNFNIPLVVEDGQSFLENSRKKAIEIAKFVNMVTIADDSGLCVEGLNGEPGIYSARYSKSGTDEDNNRTLIKNLKGIENRKANFKCVISIANPKGECYSFEGMIEGLIIDEARGKNGFGYDCHFYLKEYEKTLAEIPKIKNKISHRALAIKEMIKNYDKIKSLFY